MNAQQVRSEMYAGNRVQVSIGPPDSRVADPAAIKTKFTAATNINITLLKIANYYSTHYLYHSHRLYF